MFGSTWSNQNQSQQQQPTNTFGQPAAFGSTTNNAFGATNTFGQPQQQQQPQVNPMFGNLGAPAPATNTGFGGFGGGNTNTTTSAFGAKPATGFGAFGGGTSAFGSTGTTSAFGQPAAQPQQTTSVFGQPATTTPGSAFGSTSGLFGATKPAFGTAAGTTGSKFPVVTTGTASPPYAATPEKEVANSNATSQFQAIVSMEAYSGYSFEELRVQDYAQNRKTATTSGFGAAGAFGTTQPATTSVFGTQPAQPTTTSIFGTPAPAAPTTTGTGFGAFGQPAAQPAANTGSIFGTGSAFGQQNQQQPATSAFGAFGQPQQQPQQTSIFGSTPSAFGNTANKPATTGFGGFGTGTTTTNTFGTGGTFGTAQQQQQQQPAQTTSLFGGTQPTNTTSAFSGFGNTAAKPSIFGAPQPAAQPAASAFGTFGNTQQQTQPAQQSQPSGLFGTSSLFGNNQQQQQQNPAQATTSLFGQANTNTTTTTPSLFGNTNTGGSLFGNTQQNQQQQQQQQQQPAGSGLFGNLFNKPAQPTTSLFGQNANTGNTQTQQPNSLFTNTMGGNQTNSLFGNKPAAPALGTSLSGNASGLFGNSTVAPQGSLVTSISQPISENVPLYSLLNSAPRVFDLDQSQAAKKKAGFFVDIPTRSPVPRVQMGYTPANSKLRGFGSSTNPTSSTGSPFTSSVSFTSGKPNALIPNKSDARSSSVGPDFLGRSGSPSLGSGARQSVKKVILDKKVDPTELFVKSGSPGGMRSGKVTFSPALSVASREKDATQTTAPQVQESPTPAQRMRTPNKFTAQSTKDIAPVDNEKVQSTELTEGDYYLKPDLPSLKKAGYDQLSSFEGLIVGRKGYGEIHFLEPVDLTGLPKLGALLGEVVRFDDKECSVYPDSEDVDKPPPGSGLNVKARLILEHCWGVDKASREPIKDASHPHAVKHLKRLKNMKDTHFENFNIKTGTWTFTVDHF